MSGEPGPPHLKRVGVRDGMSIWVVDGNYIRTNIDIEFTNYGHHLVFPFIPENELWLDREAVEDEQEFFIRHMLVEHALMAKGMPYGKATDEAGAAELSMRRDAGDLERMEGNDGSIDASRAHVKLWKRVGQISIWIIDGRLVRSALYVDFTEGGHDRVYRFVPRNEVWIDNDLSDGEREFVLLHELHERSLMLHGYSYARAHESAHRLERRARRNPKALAEMLSREERPRIAVRASYRKGRKR